MKCCKQCLPIQLNLHQTNIALMQELLYYKTKYQSLLDHIRLEEQRTKPDYPHTDRPKTESALLQVRKKSLEIDGRGKGKEGEGVTRMRLSSDKTRFEQESVGNVFGGKKGINFSSKYKPNEALFR